jgi:hypothetical protein
MDMVRVNNVWQNATTLANPSNASHGWLYYNATFAYNAWPSGNNTYNDTTASIFLAGPTDASLRVAALQCPVGGCFQVSWQQPGLPMLPDECSCYHAAGEL